MDRVPSDNLDNLLMALAKIEYRDIVGTDIRLAKKLVTLFNTMTKMLDYEIQSRDVNKFMPPVQGQGSDCGAWPNG